MGARLSGVHLQCLGGVDPKLAAGELAFVKRERCKLLRSGLRSAAKNKAVVKL